jgi:hypothetical protein
LHLRGLRIPKKEAAGKNAQQLLFSGILPIEGESYLKIKNLSTIIVERFDPSDERV